MYHIIYQKYADERLFMTFINLQGNMFIAESPSVTTPLFNYVMRTCCAGRVREAQLEDDSRNLGSAVC